MIPVNESSEIDTEAFDSLIGERTRVLAICQVSNSLGTLNPIKSIIAKAKAAGITTLVDGAQGAPHLLADVQDLGCDFYVFSGHKIYGPTGIGVLWGRTELLDSMPPYKGGGDMIQRVTFEKTTYKGIPQRFEAGTPNIGGAAGLASAITYVQQFDPEELRAHETDVLEYALAMLGDMQGLTSYTRASKRAGAVSFTLDGIHPHDIATILDREGIAIRAGNHCTQPLMQSMGVTATARASFAMYNTKDEVDQLVNAIKKAYDRFS